MCILNPCQIFIYAHHFFKENNSIKRPFFSGEITPKPVLTTRGLCFAMNAKSMTQIFKRNQHIRDFETVFGNNAEDYILNGNQKIIDLSIDMHSKYLNDRASITAGSFWYAICNLNT